MPISTRHAKPAVFYGIGRGFGRLRAEDPAPDTQGEPVTSSLTDRQALRAKMQAVIDDDAQDDPDELEGGGTAAQARSRERARCQAIMGCSAAAGRKNYAAHLAFNTRLTRQDAIALLENVPLEAQGYGQYAAPRPQAVPSKQATDASWDETMKRLEERGVVKRNH